MKRSRRVATTLYMLDGGPEGHLWRTSPVPPGCRRLPCAEMRPALAMKRERSSEDLAIRPRAFCAIAGPSDERASPGSGQPVSPQWSFFAGSTSPSSEPSVRQDLTHLARASCSSMSSSVDTATTEESAASDTKTDSARTSYDSDSMSGSDAASSREPSDSEREMFGDISESQGDADSDDPPSDHDGDGETDDSALGSSHDSPDLLLGRSPLAVCGLGRQGGGGRLIGPPPSRRRQRRRRRRERTQKIASPSEHPSAPSAMDEEGVENKAITKSAVAACFGYAAAGKAGEFHREWRVMSGANQGAAPPGQSLINPLALLGKRSHHDRHGHGHGRSGYQPPFNSRSDPPWSPFAVVRALPVPAHAAPPHGPVDANSGMTEGGGGSDEEGEEGAFNEGDEDPHQLFGGAMLIVG